MKIFYTWYCNLVKQAEVIFVFTRFRRQTHVTPKSYLSFLDGYLTLYKTKYEEIGELARRMNTGLEKLIEASAAVDILSKELVVKEKDLAVANVKADKVRPTQTFSNLVDSLLPRRHFIFKFYSQLIVCELHGRWSFD